MGQDWTLKVEGDRNRNLQAVTRNLPGIRLPGLVPGSPFFRIIGNWLGTWFQHFSFFLAEPRSSGLTSWCKPVNSWFWQEVPVFSQEVLGSKQEVLVPNQEVLDLN